MNEYNVLEIRRWIRSVLNKRWLNKRLIEFDLGSSCPVAFRK